MSNTKNLDTNENLDEIGKSIVFGKKPYHTTDEYKTNLRTRIAGIMQKRGEDNSEEGIEEIKGIEEIINTYTTPATKEEWEMLNKGEIDDQHKKTTTATDETEQIQSNKFIERYERDKDIAEKLNQNYYNSNEGGFWGGMNSFYDEGSIIFARSTWKSKVFRLEKGKLVDLNKNYWELAKVGNFYIGTNIQTREEGTLQQKIDGSESYFLINKNGEEKKSLRGHVSFGDRENIYVEYFKEDNNEYTCLYDNNFEKIVDNIPQGNVFLAQKNGKLLFANNNKQDGKNYFLMGKGEIWSDKTDKYKKDTDDEIKNIYDEYLSKMKPQKEKKETETVYKISYKSNTKHINEITGKEGNNIFSTDEFDYSIAYGSNINDGIFLLNGMSNGKYIKDIFINEEKGITLKFDKMPSSTFITGKVLKHFINNNDSELYNIDTGKKLGKSTSYRDNEHNFQIVETENGKTKLVENLTGNCLEQEFDKILKVYDNNSEKVVIVKNGDNIIDLHIKK